MTTDYNPFRIKLNEQEDNRQDAGNRETAVPRDMAPENRAKGWYIIDITDSVLGGPYVDKSEAQRKFREIKRNPGYMDKMTGAKVKYWTGKRWASAELNEERSATDNAASLIERATGICMESWYSMTKTFNANPDKFDPYPVNPSDKFMHFKLAPGGDARNDAYKKIIDETERLCEKLNDALGRALFVPEIVRQNGKLKTIAKYEEGKGAIFKCETSDGQEVGVVIKLTMPRQGVIRQAFSSLITTPEFPIGDVEQIPEPQDVVPDQPQDSEPQQRQEQPPQERQMRTGTDDFEGAPLSSDSFERKAELRINQEARQFFKAVHLQELAEKLLVEGAYDGLLGIEAELYSAEIEQNQSFGTGTVEYVYSSGSGSNNRITGALKKIGNYIIGDDEANKEAPQNYYEAYLKHTQTGRYYKGFLLKRIDNLGTDKYLPSQQRQMMDQAPWIAVDCVSVSEKEVLDAIDAEKKEEELRAKANSARQEIKKLEQELAVKRETDREKASKRNFDKLMRTLDKFMDGMGKALNNLAGVVTAAGVASFNFIVQILDSILTIAGRIISAIKDGLVQLFNVAADVLQQVIDLAVQIFEGLIDLVVEVFRVAASRVFPILKNIFRQIIDALGKILQQLANLAMTIVQLIIEIFTFMVKMIKKMVEKLGRANMRESFDDGYTLKPKPVTPETYREAPHEQLCRALKPNDSFTYFDRGSKRSKQGVVIENDVENRQVFAKIPYAATGLDAKGHISYDDIRFSDEKVIKTNEAKSDSENGKDKKKKKKWADAYKETPKPPKSEKSQKAPRNEEVAANAVATGAINSGQGEPDPYSDVRTAMKKRRAAEKAKTTKMWKRQVQEETSRPSEDKLEKFYNYVMSFYGEGQIYPLAKDGNKFLTKEDVIAATDRLLSLKERNPDLAIPFDGDTVDRENVRTILEDEFGYREVDSQPLNKRYGFTGGPFSK